MKLYHGSTVNIDTILLAKSKPNKDFGRAFYLSAERAQAVELAESRVAYPELTLKERPHIVVALFQFCF